MECLTESAEDRQRKTESHEPAENRNARLKLKEGGEIMKNDEKNDTLYLCDPQKNTECPKGNCQIPDGCFLTIKKEFAETFASLKDAQQRMEDIKKLLK